MFINPKAKTKWNRAGAGSVGGGAKKGSEHSGRLVLLTNDEK